MSPANDRRRLRDLFLTAFGTGVFLVLFLLIAAATFLKSDPASTLTTTPITSGPVTPTPETVADVGLSPLLDSTQQLQVQSTPEPIPTEASAPAPSPTVVLEPSSTPVPETQPVAVPGAPPSPAGLSVTYSAEGVVLNWNVVEGAAYYNVYRSQVPGGGPNATYTAIGSSGAPSFVDTTALSGQSYHYVVTASGAGIESASSNEASIQIP